jgi:hypothetical protein
LKEDSFEGVLAVEVFATSLGPEVVEQEASEDVKGLAAVSEAARMIAVEVRGVVIRFEDGFPQEDEGPGDVEAVGSSPFVPNTEENIPSLPSQVAFHEVMLGGFREPFVTGFASGRDSHGLEPRANRKSIVEDQPGERPNFARMGVVPHLSNDLGDRRVSKV